MSDQPDDVPSDLGSLEAELLGGERRYDRNKVAELGGVTTEEAETLWRALGFPSTRDGEVAFTDRDLDALLRVKAQIAAGWLDEQTALAMTRALGQSLSRLAEWQVSTLMASGLAASDPQWALDRARHLVPEVEELIAYVWRRHLAATTLRGLNAGGEVATRQLTVGFVDLVNYTGLTRHIDEAELADLVEAFDTLAADVVAELGGRVVKTVGDEVLFVADTATSGLEIALRLSERIETDGRLPESRAGVAHGSVLARLGDVYGEPVNLAARLTSVARPASVLVDRNLVETLAGDTRYSFKRVPPRPVRGYALLQPFRARRS